MSDASAQCSATADGMRCQKRHAPGHDFHAGGHMYGPDNLTTMLDTWHYDATSLLAGQPTPMHPPGACTHDPCPTAHPYRGA